MSLASGLCLPSTLAHRLMAMRGLALLTLMLVASTMAVATRASGLCFLSITSRRAAQRSTISTANSYASAAASASPGVLDEIETTLSNVFSNGITPDTNLLDLPSHQREAVGVAINTRQRLDSLERNRDCRTCWLQQKHCVCSQCPPCEYDTSSGRTLLPQVNRLFLLMHHKEIGLVVDTAKLLLSSFPKTSRLVVGGIGSEYQPSMGEMLDAFNGDRCLVLFPSAGARVFEEIEAEETRSNNENPYTSGEHDRWDVVVIDGTWQQARKLYNRYISGEEEGGPERVQLSEAAVAILNCDNVEEGTTNNDGEGERLPGHQLRRHPIKWREVSTLEATRLLLRDMMDDGSPSSDAKPWDTLATYQRIANNAAQRQLGPPRISTSR